jgi:catechol 2,3-dioxygenase-like lactoylglutathione lyase family enzyme
MAPRGAGRRSAAPAKWPTTAASTSSRACPGCGGSSRSSYRSAAAAPSLGITTSKATGYHSKSMQAPNIPELASAPRQYGGAVFAHVAIRVSDFAASERFYRAVLGALGVAPTYAREDLVVWDDFAIMPSDSKRPATRNVHIAFVAPTREHVRAFWRAGLGAGGQDDGKPGERPQYTPSYYGAFLGDPDGNSAEAVIHDDTRRGGNIDHLWIGVRDLDDSSAFYSATARYTGLREGRRWDCGRQFRGAWATFSLVADGRAQTEHLHVAFPAPDVATVQEFHEAATAAGYRDNGGPGERPQYGPGYYGAFVLDPDGTNVESVFHGPD